MTVYPVAAVIVVVVFLAILVVLLCQLDPFEGGS